MTIVQPQPTAVRHYPVRIAPETFVIQNTYGEGVSPLAVHLNSMVIRSEQPVVVDTGVAPNRERFLEDLFGIIEPGDVRWIYLSHDDADHVGSLQALLDACPKATVIANWFLCERLACDGVEIPPTRLRWLSDGETFDAGDRMLAVVRPPLYDSPTTRGLFDPKTGVYWAADCYATPVPAGTAFVEDLDPGFWADGFTAFQAWNSPWVTALDRSRFAQACARIERLGVSTIASAHGPTVDPGHVSTAFEMLRQLPDAEVPPQPGQPVLDEIVAALSA